MEIRGLFTAVFVTLLFGCDVEDTSEKIPLVESYSECPDLVAEAKQFAYSQIRALTEIPMNISCPAREVMEKNNQFKDLMTTCSYLELQYYHEMKQPRPAQSLHLIIHSNLVFANGFMSRCNSIKDNKLNAINNDLTIDYYREITEVPASQ